MSPYQMFVSMAALVSCVDCRTTSYYMDKFCQTEGVQAKWIEDDDIIMVKGKSLAKPNFRECNLSFAPSGRANKLSMKIMFDTYSNTECDVHLAMLQSPYNFFEKEVTTMFNFSCFMTPGKAVFYTDAGNNIKIILSKRRWHSMNYNFGFNITLTDHEETSGLSAAIIITIGVIVAVAIPGVGCIIFRYLKIKRWTKQQGEISHDLHPMHSASNVSSSATPPIRYSSMPQHTDAADMSSVSQSHACVLGTEGPDGVCTMCHTRHEDFAHVVDIVDQRNANRNRHHRSHEDFLQVNNVHSSPRIRGTHHPSHRHSQPLSDALRVVPRSSHNTPTQTIGFLSQPTAIPAAAIPADPAWSSDDDDDIDLSGNDLIPPSYDLSPPSYDEAVSMPKPSTDLGVSTAGHSNSQREAEESDPLYQNINTFTDVR